MAAGRCWAGRQTAGERRTLTMFWGGGGRRTERRLSSVKSWHVRSDEKHLRIGLLRTFRSEAAGMRNTEPAGAAKRFF